MPTIGINLSSRMWRPIAGALLSALLLVGCGDDPAQPVGAAATPKQAQAQAQAAEDETKGMVAGVTDEKKKGAPVDLKFEIHARPTLEEPLPIDIAFIPRQSSELLRATFLATDGISVMQSPQPAEYRNVMPQRVYRHTLTVVPKQTGVFYVTAIVVMNTISGTAEARTFQIPLLVGSPSEATEATSAESEDASTGEKPASTDSN